MVLSSTIGRNYTPLFGFITGRYIVISYNIAAAVVVINVVALRCNDRHRRCSLYRDRIRIASPPAKHPAASAVRENGSITTTTTTTSAQQVTQLHYPRALAQQVRRANGQLILLCAHNHIITLQYFKLYRNRNDNNTLNVYTVCSRAEPVATNGNNRVINDYVIIIRQSLLSRVKVSPSAYDARYTDQLHRVPPVVLYKPPIRFPAASESDVLVRFVIASSLPARLLPTRVVFPTRPRPQSAAAAVGHRRLARRTRALSHLRRGHERVYPEPPAGTPRTHTAPDRPTARAHARIHQYYII